MPDQYWNESMMSDRWQERGWRRRSDLDHGQKLMPAELYIEELESRVAMFEAIIEEGGES